MVWLSQSIRSEIGSKLADHANEMARLSLDRAMRELSGFTEQMRRDALSIAHYPPIRGLLRSRDAGGIDPIDGSTSALWRSRLESLFATFGSARRDVFKVRLIDEGGREWVRLQGSNGVLKPVPESELQDKSTRYYYRNAIHLPEGHCYITELDLNEEHGRVEEPHRPVIRVSTPVWFEGRSRGIVVVSYTPRFLLDGLAWAGDGTVFMANKEGYYLHNSDEGKCWSNQLGGDFNMFNDWPALQEALATGQERVTHADQSLFFARFTPNEDDPEHWWLLGVQQDKAVLQGAVANMDAATTQALIGVSAITLIVALIMASAWGRPITRLAMAATALEAGDLSVRVPAKRRDEIGDLGRAFNGMADTIAGNTEHLEALVRERTLELDTQKRALDEHAIVSITDVRGNITYANNKFCRISGFTRAELIGRNHRIVKSDEHAPEFYRNLWRTISRGEVWHGQIKNRRKDGTGYWVDATIVPFKDSAGRITQYVAIRTDISRAKFTEARLEAVNLELEGRREELEAQQAELVAINTHLEEAQARAMEATKAKSEFLANMSHEIRTPMTAIVGFAETLREDSGLALNPQQRAEAIETIQRNGEYLLCLINDILDMSKIEAGKMTVERIGCCVMEIVADAHGLMKGRTDAKNLTLNVEYADAIPETIESDPTRLKQILINLLSNAVKFTDEGGIRTVVRFISDDTHPKMQFDVIDTGVGMTSEQAAKLFRPFSQADTSTTRRFGGTGLGLTISKHFAELLGGDITIVSSTPGRGTCFRVTIATGPLHGVKMIHPSQVTPANRAGDVRSASSPAERPLDCRILLAEDGPDNQRLISFVLERAGAEVTIAENGRLAVDAARAAVDRAEPFDVILMDMQMPVLDGYGATAELRAGGYEGPIIALTAHAMAGDRQKCLDAGCVDYASKPIDRLKLIETIQHHLKRAAAV